mgnify:CR=1 FL=1
MIAIIDYDAGNIKKCEKSTSLSWEETTVTRDPQTLLNADKVILPAWKLWTGDGESSYIRTCTCDP